MAEELDLIVIGAGPGGYAAAIRAAQLGIKAACVDQRAALGGTCLNIGCIPSKALLESSELLAAAQAKLADHGIEMNDVQLNLKKMMERKERVVGKLVDGLGHLFKKNQVQFVQGTAHIDEPGRITVTPAKGKASELQADVILLAAGSVPVPLPGADFDGKTIVSSTEALSFDHVPEHLVVVGGGYIGLELGSVWSRLGAKVTVLEMLPRILNGSDQELAKLVQKSLAKQGIEFHLQTKVTEVKTSKGKVTVLTESEEDHQEFKGDKLLVAVGRKPCSGNLGLDDLGLEVDEKSGRLKVDEDYQTNVKGVYAIGDLIDGPMLAHKAQAEGIAFAERLAGHSTQVNYQAIPSVVYTWPELAAVGQTEEQVKESGREYRVARSHFAANGRALCLGETEGLVKVITDKQTDRLLGVHMFGPRASELIAEAVTALEFSASAEDLASISHAHPTLAETLAEAARAAFIGKSIHS